MFKWFAHRSDLTGIAESTSVQKRSRSKVSFPFKITFWVISIMLVTFGSTYGSGMFLRSNSFSGPECSGSKPVGLATAFGTGTLLNGDVSQRQPFDWFVQQNHYLRTGCNGN